MDQRARRSDSPARYVAMHADLHRAAGPKQAEQNPPALPRRGEVIEKPGAMDEIELFSERAALHDIGLREFEIGQAETLRHAFAVAQTRKIEIDGENASVVGLPCELDGRETACATRNENIDGLGWNADISD